MCQKLQQPGDLINPCKRVPIDRRYVVTHAKSEITKDALVAHPLDHEAVDSATYRVSNDWLEQKLAVEARPILEVFGSFVGIDVPLSIAHAYPSPAVESKDFGPRRRLLAQNERKHTENSREERDA